MNPPLIFTFKKMKRKRNFLLVALFVFITFNGFSQSFTPKWESCFGGTGWDEGTGMIRTGNTYWFVGETKSNDGDILFNHGAWDIFLFNIDEYGNLISEKTFGGSSFDGSSYVDIKKLNDSTFYIVGRTKSVDGDISHNPWPNPNGNYWVLQINKQGDILWDKVLGGSGIEMIRDATVTNDGGIIVLGISTSDDGDISDYHGGWDLWMEKLSRNGQKQWDMSLGGTGSEEGASVKQTSDGGYLVIGSTDGAGGGNFDSSCNYHGNPGGWLDGWVVKMDSLRNIEWQQCYGGKYHENCTNSLELEDGYIVLAYTMSNDGDVSGFHGVPGNQQLGRDIWVFKIDFQGNLIWQKCLGGTYSDYARNIFPTSDGGFMIVGSTSSKDGDVVGNHDTVPMVYRDVWFVKIDSTGNLLWQYCYGGTGLESIYRGVVQKSDRDYVITLSTDTYAWNCRGTAIPPDLRVVELYDTTVGIQEKVANTYNVKVYPNPANNSIAFSYTLPNNFENGKLTLFNSYSLLIKHFDLNKGQGLIRYNCSLLQSGIYFYSISCSSGKKSGKFFVVR